MWRRVSCEQPLHTTQSILSPRRNPVTTRGIFICVIYPSSLGERESGSYSGTRQRNRYPGSH